MANVITNGWLAGIVPKLGGFTNFADGMFVLEGIRPIGAGLHDPVVICRPLVKGCVDSAQKLIKLFPDVSDAT